MLEHIRCNLPQVFYKAVKSAVNYSNPVVIAASFRHQLDANGGLIVPPTFAEYLKDLYAPQGHEYTHERV